MSALPPDPPRWAGRLLRALLADDDHGRTILGDLHEEFGEIAADRGRGSAVAWYWWQVAVVGVGYARPGAAAVRDLGGDVRHGFRTLRRSPGFTLSVIGTLALGIGAGTAVVSVVDAVLIRPLPFPEPAELVRVWASDETGGRPAVDMLYSDVEAVSRGAEGLRAVTGLSVAPRTLLTARMEEPEAITVARTAGPFFATFGISPAAGRLYGEAEEGAGVLVISEALFRRRFGGDPAALRGLVHVDTRGFEIVGVVPERMSFPEGVDAWRPLTVAELEDDDREVRVFARLGDGVGVSAATAELRGVAAGLAESRPTTHGGFSAWAQPLQAMVVRDVRTALFAFLGAVALVLLVTCVNTANLLLARGAHRRHDLAVRAALGAGRLRIVRASLAESLVLAVLGGAAGIVAGRWALDLILAVSPRLPRMDTIHLDLRVMALMAGITAVVGLLFGVGPALHAAALPSGNALREGAVGGSRAGGRSRLQSGLVAAEIALSTALAVLAVLLFGTFQTAARHDRGFEPSNLVAFSVDPMHPPQPGEEAWDYFRRMSAGVAALPEVEQVGLGSHLIVEQRGFEVDVEVGGFPAGDRREQATVRAVSGGYFSAAGVRLASGRLFSADAGGDDDLELVVNEEFVRTFVPAGVEALGAGIRTEWARGTVVGIVADVTPSVHEPARPLLYLPFRRFTLAGGWVFVRTRTDPATLTADVWDALREVDAYLLGTQTVVMDESIRASVASERFNMIIVVVFAGLALGLAAVGIHGVTAYAVSSRREEIGIRRALGAGRARVAREVVARVGFLTAVGVALGAAGAVVGGRFLSSLFVGAEPTDPWVLVRVAVLLALVALSASIGPVWRALGILPTEALRRS